MNCGQVHTRLGDHLEGDLDLSARAQVDEHLEACTDCANEMQELRSTVALVRSLPNLTPPAGLVDSVLRRIDDGEGRRRLFSISADRWASPRLALPLAAGIAGVLFYVGANNPPVVQEVRMAAVPSAEAVVDPIAVEKWEAVPPTLSRSGVARSRLAAAPATDRARMVRPRFAAVNHSARDRFNRPDHRELVVGFFGRMDPDSAQLDLDRDLERAKADPEAFLRRLNEATEMDRRSTVAPLVVLANRRGEAHMVAERLRSAPHPLAVSLAAQFDQGRHQPVENRQRNSTIFEY